MEIIVHDCAEIIIYHIHYNRLLRLSKAIKSCIYRDVAMRKRCWKREGRKAQRRDILSVVKKDTELLRSVVGGHWIVKNMYWYLDVIF